MVSNQDKKYIERCFKLALKGRGKVSPNPLVGAVIVKNDHVISEGWHAEFGKDHAEAMAIKKAKVDLSGATLYCNLEPCIHTNKKTPPCYPLVVQAGIKRVVISNLDPNPAVAGNSVEQMQQQGIDVVSGILQEKGWELNRFFFKHIKEKKPWVAVKIAQSIDGKISKSSHEQTWLTGEESRKYVHTLRAEYDAVLAGSNTIRIDDPQLNVRAVLGRSPFKIIIAGKQKLEAQAKVFQNAANETVWVLCDEKTVQRAGNNYDKNIRFIPCPLNHKGHIDIVYILDLLYKENIGSLLVEGGHKVFSSFLQSGYCDELIILQAPIVLGQGLSSVHLQSKIEFKLNFIKKFGNDICFNLRKKQAN